MARERLATVNRQDDVRFSMRITPDEDYWLKEMASIRGGITRQRMIRYLIQQAVRAHVQNTRVVDGS